jgi:hypothetical protein
MTHTLYEGSTICLLSSQLFLLASLFHYFHCDNILETILIFSGYLTSICYHYNGNATMRLIDIWIIRIGASVCNTNSIMYNNYLPGLFTSICAFFYYMRYSSSNLYHALCVHVPAFLSFITMYFNKNEITSVN